MTHQPMERAGVAAQGEQEVWCMHVDLVAVAPLLAGTGASLCSD